MNTLVKTANAGTTQTGKWSAFCELFFPALKAHAPLFAIVALQCAFAFGLYLIVPGMTFPGLTEFALSFAAFVFVLLPLSVASLRFYHLVTKVKPEHPIPALVKDMWAYVTTPERAANGTAIVLVFVVFMNVFAHLKGSIPIVNPFSWDSTFMEWDRWLHFGNHPYEILQPILGYAPVTYAITVFYHLWFMLMWIMVAGMAFGSVSPVLRMRFFLTFMLTWGIGGNVLAMVFSSAGPCYYGLIGLAPDPFVPLMSYLNGVHEVMPLWALDTQLMLWQGYQGEGLRLGISAMPSMHNGAALLFALAGWQINRKLGMALFVFTALIFIGSIHLGWHYALDGYAGFAVALFMWWGSGLIARKWEASRWAREYATARARIA